MFAKIFVFGQGSKAQTACLKLDFVFLHDVKPIIYFMKKTLLFEFWRVFSKLKILSLFLTVFPKLLCLKVQ